MAPDLASYLAEAAGLPFAWGRADCAFFTAEWVRRRTGIDVAAPYRGRFRTAIGSARLVRRAGGIEALAAAIAASAGLAGTDDPQAGDVGVVETVAGPLFAIRGASGPAGVRWIAKHRRGIVAGPAPLVAAWRVPEAAHG